MVIQTDIRVKDETGKEGFIATGNPKELLYIMENENIEKCNIGVKWLGQETVKNMTVTKADVEKWIAENDAG